jgi:hypothetical protein
MTVKQGYTRERVPGPQLPSKGQKGKTCLAFSKEEVEQLLVFMAACSQQGRLAVERALMIERHYSKLTAAMAADKLV